VIEFRCPACGFRVFNRRYSRCEGCGAGLPAELLLSDADIELRERRQAELNRMFLATAPRRSGWRGVVDDLVKPMPDSVSSYWWLHWPFWP